MSFRGIALLPILIMFGVAEHAAASGFQLIEQNASGIGNAFGGSAAVAENASTIFFNPAGMTQLRARATSAGVSAVRPSFKFTDNGSSIPTTLPPGYAPLSGEGGDGGSLAYIPNGYFSSALDKDLYVGIGFSSPFGLITEYDDAWFGAAQSVKFDIKTYNINPSIAYRVNDTLSLGLGINWMRMDAEYTKRYASTKTPPGIVPATASNPIATLKADANAWGWNVGALFDLSPTTRIGLSYRSTIKQKLDGTLAINGGSSFDTKADIKLPDTAILSIAHPLRYRARLQMARPAQTLWALAHRLYPLESLVESWCA